MKLKLTEQHIVRILQESEQAGEMLSTYKLLARKINQRVNSMYGTLRNMTIGEIISKEFNADKYENELRALDSANEKMYHKFSDHIEKHTHDEDTYLELDSLAHDINMGVYRKINTLENLLSNLVSVHDNHEDIQDYFSDMNPLDV